MSLGDLVRLVSSRYPLKTAIIFGKQSWSYWEFDAITDKIAASLVMQGIQKGDCVALHLSNCPEMVFCYYACFKIGAIAVPINTRLKAPEIEYIFNHCQAKICISQTDLFAEIQPIITNLQTVKSFYLVGSDSIFDIQPFAKLLQCTENVSFPLIHRDDFAAILYTSGTTSRPKGVTHTYHSLQRTAAYHAQQIGLNETDTSGVMLPMCHIFGFALQVIGAVSVGATLVIMPQFEPSLVLENISQHQITRIYGLPVMFNALINHPNITDYQLDSLKMCLAGGDAVPVVLQEKFQAITGIEILEGCGMTEVIPYTMNPIEAKQAGSIGKAAIGMKLRLVDTLSRDVAQGEVGEILVQSDAMMVGYWNNAEATGATIQDGWLHTGDLAYMDKDGYYWFVSRQKEIIIRGGSNISPLEIEAVLYQHHSIREAGVIGVSDSTWGEIVQAFVSLHEEYPTSKSELLEFLKARIAAYKVPENIIFLPELPKGLTGKIHRKTLRDWTNVSKAQVTEPTKATECIFPSSCHIQSIATNL